MRAFAIIFAAMLACLALAALWRIVGWISRAVFSDTPPRGAALGLTIIAAVAIGLLIRWLR